ncbi:MAG: hypothetical protein ABIB79_05135 [archaeon]
MNNKYALGVVSLVLIGLLATSFVSAFGFGNGIGFMNQDMGAEQIAVMQGEQEAIQQAIADEDYDEWKSLMTAQLTEERFQELVEKHKQNSEMQELREEMKTAWETGDYDRVDDLREQLAEDMPEGCQGTCGAEGKGMMHQQGKQGFWGRFRFW